MRFSHVGVVLKYAAYVGVMVAIDLSPEVILLRLAYGVARELGARRHARLTLA